MKDLTAELEKRKQQAFEQWGPQRLAAALADYRLMHGDDASAAIAEQDEEDDVSHASTGPSAGCVRPLRKRMSLWRRSRLAATPLAPTQRIHPSRLQLAQSPLPRLGW